MAALPVSSAYQAVTFKGRGQGSSLGGRILLHVCPLCSQRNAPVAEQNGQCAWCAYIPDPADVELVPPSSPASR
ncbi:hypothetical protein QA634_34110 [Methylobacterium sp. CB376]|nr:hypothetical protein [Methylobacterium nodulans]WFT83721.1 hypothetical protein QA634_34110 [Methylobacterium nodulans]